MIHYDAEINATTFFRPQLKDVINQVTSRKWVGVPTLKALFEIIPHTRIDTWAYSFKLTILSYLIMFGVGISGIFLPYDLFLILFPFLLWASDRNILLSVLAHGVALGFIVAISPNLLFIGIACLLFLILRLGVDVPSLKTIKTFKLRYDHVGVLYAYGYKHSQIKEEDVLMCVRYLKDSGIPEGIIISTYVLGHYMSEDETHEPVSVTGFITNLLREGTSD